MPDWGQVESRARASENLATIRNETTWQIADFIRSCFLEMQLEKRIQISAMHATWYDKQHSEWDAEPYKRLAVRVLLQLHANVLLLAVAIDRHAQWFADW